MSEVDLRKVVEMVGGEPVVKFVKGDVPGHEFHGNQWTGSGPTETKTAGGTVKDHFSQQHATEADAVKTAERTAASLKNAGYKDYQSAAGTTYEHPTTGHKVSLTIQNRVVRAREHAGKK